MAHIGVRRTVRFVVTRREQALNDVATFVRLSTDKQFIVEAIADVECTIAELAEFTPSVVAGRRRIGRLTSGADGSEPGLLELAGLHAKLADLNVQLVAIDRMLSDVGEAEAAVKVVEAECLTVWRADDPWRAAGIDTRDQFLALVPEQLLVSRRRLRLAQQACVVGAELVSALRTLTSQATCSTVFDQVVGVVPLMAPFDTASHAQTELFSLCDQLDDVVLWRYVSDLTVDHESSLSRIVDVFDAARVVVAVAEGVCERETDLVAQLEANYVRVSAEREALFAGL